MLLVCRESHLHSTVRSCKRKCFAHAGFLWPKQFPRALSIFDPTTVATRNWRAEFRIISIGKSDVTGEKRARSRLENNCGCRTFGIGGRDHWFQNRERGATAASADRSRKRDRRKPWFDSIEDPCAGHSAL